MPAQYKCNDCHKDFQRKGDLKRHEKLHTGEKPHVCAQCGKAFAQFTGLKTHRNVHTGAKPHECNVCGARFGDPSSCARHKRETHMHPEGYHCFVNGCRTKIKRRSAFVKHVKAKHHIDMTSTSVEEAAAAAYTGKDPLDIAKAPSPPPDYRTASKVPLYLEEELPTFQSGVMPKREANTPPSFVASPPAVINLIPSSDGFRWSSADYIDHTTLDAGIVCASPDLVLLADSQNHPQPPILEANCFYYPQQPPSYYEQQWSGTPIPVHSVAPADIFNSSPPPHNSGADYNFSYDQNTCGDFNSQVSSSLRDPSDMTPYMTPLHMTPYHFRDFS